MKAVVCHDFEGVAGLQIETIAAPRPGRDDVRIAVHCASVNDIDLLIARGLYQIRPDLPYVVGAEGVGEVIEVGADVANVAPGERVAFFHLTGAFAEEMLAKHWRVIALPDGVPYDTAAATLHNYFTAVTAAYALRERAGTATALESRRPDLNVRLGSTAAVDGPPASSLLCGLKRTKAAGKPTFRALFRQNFKPRHYRRARGLAPFDPTML